MKIIIVGGGNAEAAEALEFVVTSDFKYTDVPLKRLQTKDNVLIAGITRQGQAIIPGGDDFIK